MAFDSLFGSICLTDIQMDCITTGTDGKKYINVSICKRRAPSSMGSTHYIKVVPKPQEAKPGVNYYIGNLKEMTLGADSNNSRTDNGNDKLPWE